MLSRPHPHRRPLHYALAALTLLSFFYFFGPPIFSPSTHASVAEAGKAAEEKALGFAHTLQNDVSSIYHKGGGAPDALSASNMGVSGTGMEEGGIEGGVVAPGAAPNGGKGGNIKPPRIRQATMLYEGDRDHLRPVYERAVKSHIEHGKKWGVPTHVMSRHLVEEGSFFNKPAWLLYLIMAEMGKPKAQRSEWVVWFDADSVVMNPEVDWGVFLPPAGFEDKFVLATRDNNGFNAGMLMLKVNEWTVDMLSQVIALKGLREDVETPFFDQSAIDWVCQRKGYEEHFLYQPRRWWNRYFHDKDGEEKGVFVLHFAGINTLGTEGTRIKLEHMTRWLDRAEGEGKAEWVVPVGKTGLEKEVEGYWSGLRRSRKVLDKAIERVRKEKERAKGGEEDEDEEDEEERRKVEDATNDLIKVVVKEADMMDKVAEATKVLEGLLD